MAKKFRVTGFFYFAAAAVAGIGGLLTYAHTREGGIPALLAADPVIPAPEAARQLATDLTAQASTYFAPDYHDRERVELKRLCDELDTAVNGTLEQSGAASRLTFAYDPRIDDDSSPHGQCVISFNAYTLAILADARNVDEANEIADIHARIIAALPEADIHKLSTPPIQEPAP